MCVYVYACVYVDRANSIYQVQDDWAPNENQQGFSIPFAQQKSKLHPTDTSNQAYRRIVLKLMKAQITKMLHIHKLQTHIRFNAESEKYCNKHRMRFCNKPHRSYDRPN